MTVAIPANFRTRWELLKNCDNVDPRYPPGALRFVFVIIFLLVKSMSAAYAQESTSNTTDLPPEVLQPGSYSFLLQPGQMIVRRLRYSNNLLIRAIDKDVNSKISITNLQGDTVSSANNWHWREGDYYLLLEPLLPQDYWLVIESFDTTGPAGEVTLEIQQTTQSPITLNLLRQITIANTRRFNVSFGDQNAVEALVRDFYRAAEYAKRHEMTMYEAWIRYELAEVLVQASESDAAWSDELINQAEMASKLYAELGDYQNQAGALNVAGLALRGMGKPKEALNRFEQAAALRQTHVDGFLLHQATLYNNMGLASRDLGNYDEAMRFYDKALKVYQCGEKELHDLENYIRQVSACGGDVGSASNTLNNLALVHDDIGQVGKAEYYWRNYLSLSELLGNQFAVAKARQNLGGLLSNLGQFEDAMRLLTQAQEYFDKHPNAEWQSLTLGNIGRIHDALGNYFTALDYFQRAYAAAENLNRLQVKQLRNMGKTFFTLYQENARLGFVGAKQGGVSKGEALNLSCPPGEFDLDEKHYLELASACLTKALNSLTEIVDRPTQAMSSSLNGMVMAGLGRVAEAESFSNRALLYAEKNHLIRSGGRFLSHFAEVKIAQGQYAEALPLLKRALEKHREISDALYELKSLQLTIQAEIALGHDSALDYAKAATDAAERLRISTVTPNLRAQFLASRRRIYESYLTLLVKACDDTDVQVSSKQMGHCAAKATWLVAERTRARGLIDLVDVETGSNGASVTNGAVNRENLKRELAAVTAKLEEGGEAQDVLQARFIELREQLGPDEHFNLPAVQAYSQIPSVAEFQTLLRPGELVLGYFLGSTESYLWSVDSENITLHLLPSRHEIEPLITGPDQLYAYLTTRRSAPRSVAALASKLHEILIPDDLPLNDYDHVIVMPDGALHQLPFELLASERHGQIMDRRAVSYLNSAALLRVLRERKTGQGQGVAVVADPLFNPSNVTQPKTIDTDTAKQFLGYLPPLPGSGKEALAIQHQAQTVGVPVTLMMQQDAQLKSILNGVLNGHDIIHFGTHGFVNDVTPELSRLALAAEPGAAAASMLTASDIASLKLSASLVVLSGCETAKGKLIEGEGVLSLTRPFFVAGVNQVVASLWKVDDDSTAALMEQFYAYYLRDNLSAAEALQAAKQWMKVQTTQAAWQHPYYWAGFTLQGDWAAQNSLSHGSR